MLPMGSLVLVISAWDNAILANNLGTLSPQCPNKSFKYCKKRGNIIKESPIRPPKPVSRALQAVNVPAIDPSLSSIADSSASAAVMSQGTPIHPSLTPEMVQQMILSAFSTLGLQGAGNGTIDSKGA
ncbi:Hypothetical predicted protein [Olea europaea subsp. europaea]|uniref:Uncharacterized protein n=1 Tax=Olea europaea subsp. europaea TaxID=158383 RepID=A0A8S0P6G1_OLEEU|nr:Hypothetical predicted protein [Olea europaea subsp. europaea]